MYVQSFRRWIVDHDDNNNNNNNNDQDDNDTNEGISARTQQPLRMDPIKGAGLSNLPIDDGWVNPTTISELWWPRDLKRLQVRPMLNVLFRNGNISYLSAGLDVRVPHTTAAESATTTTNDDDDDDDDVVSWRNYGLNSQPIARVWTTLDIAMEKLFHVEAFILQKENGDNNDEQHHHESLFPSRNVQDVMKKVATFIAEVDTSSPIAEGFHIASFPMTKRWTDLPSSPTTPEKKASSGEKEEETMTTTTGEEEDDETLYKIVCLATSEPFTNELLKMDEDLFVMSSTSVLEVSVSRTARGGDSPYLTEPYKGLYLSDQ